jgi:hypothetical protein
MGGLTDVIETKILPVVSKVAPLLGSVLGTPLAGVAISLMSQAFGVNPSDLNALNNAISESPEAAIKLKTLEYEHAETLAKIASTDYDTEVEDRKDARELAKTVDYKDFLRHMAYIVTAGFFCALLLLFCPIPINPQGRELLSMLVGMLVSKWQTIIDFFYGSSRSRQGGLK